MFRGRQLWLRLFTIKVINTTTPKKMTLLLCHPSTEFRISAKLGEATDSLRAVGIRVLTLMVPAGQSNRCLYYSKHVWDEDWRAHRDVDPWLSWRMWRYPRQRLRRLISLLAPFTGNVGFPYRSSILGQSSFNSSCFEETLMNVSRSIFPRQLLTWNYT